MHKSRHKIKINGLIIYVYLKYQNIIKVMDKDILKIVNDVIESGTIIQDLPESILLSIHPYCYRVKIKINKNHIIEFEK